MSAVRLPARAAIGGSFRGSRFAHPWAIDPDAFAEAVAYFDLEWPVIVKLAGGRRRNGSQRSRLAAFEREADAFVRLGACAGGDRVHVVTVSTYLSPANASATLWHELTHCSQDERHGAKEMSVMYAADPAPFEAEAREHEVLADVHPITKEIT